ncbi:pantoate--beta-alanine ligase, partial [bacterium]|nr:pantoate--beta-alanine ligase [bacterium]
PKQFNVSADLAAYPRDEERDCELLRERGVEAVFIPPVEEVYPGGHSSTVQVSGLTEHYEGAGRPGHFEGVATVLTILFLLVRPNSAIFGEKDFQQLRTVEKLVKDLRLDLEIIRGPLIREADGLALSSRNERLSTEGRTRALALSQALRLVRGNYESGSTGREELLAAGRAILEAQEGVRIEYLDVVSEKTLLPLDDASSEPSRVLLAATVEGVRLLDNIALFG